MALERSPAISLLLRRYDDPTYKSESGSADRNWCLGYMMKESGAFPPCFADRGLGETLELYFQICSILNTNEGMAIMAATLANGGLNPMSGKRVFTPDQVRNVLPIKDHPRRGDRRRTSSATGACLLARAPRALEPPYLGYDPTEFHKSPQTV